MKIKNEKDPCKVINSNLGIHLDIKLIVFMQIIINKLNVNITKLDVVTLPYEEQVSGNGVRITVAITYFGSNI